MRTHKQHAIAHPKFFKILETSHSVGEESGWIPQHFKINDSLLPGYIKLHSYGEYIFDWDWARLYAQNQLAYYPKLIHAIPFTPVNAPKFLGNEQDFPKLARESFKFYQEHELSSEHYLFINSSEEEILNSMGFSIKITHQYHFYNRYESFDHFLTCLKKNRRKNIKKERRLITESDLSIQTLTHEQITPKLLTDFYQFYLSTISKKGSYAYLTPQFFRALEDQNICLITAKKETKIIAMSLFFYDEKTLYGRYWGILPNHESSYPYLHFELCYYRGIEFCIAEKLKVFEAGAQGEHKLIRGFIPQTIKSAHHLKLSPAFDIVKKDIQQQNKVTLENIKKLKSYLPFKESEVDQLSL